MLWSNAGWAADLQHWWFGALGLFIGASTYGYYRDGRRQVA